MAATYGAARNGHLNVLEWACDGKFDVIPALITEHALHGGHDNVLQWIDGRGWFKIWSPQLCKRLAYSSSIEVFQRALRYGCEWSSICVLVAVEGFNFELAEWLIESGCPWNFEECRDTLVSGCERDDAMLNLLARGLLRK